MVRGGPARPRPDNPTTRHPKRTPEQRNSLKGPQDGTPWETRKTGSGSAKTTPDTQTSRHPDGSARRYPDTTQTTHTHTQSYTRPHIHNHNHTHPPTHKTTTTTVIQSRNAPSSFATMRLRREEPPHHSGELSHAFSLIGSPKQPSYPVPCRHDITSPSSSDKGRIIQVKLRHWCKHLQEKRGKK